MLVNAPGRPLQKIKKSDVDRIVAADDIVKEKAAAVDPKNARALTEPAELCRQHEQLDEAKKYAEEGAGAARPCEPDPGAGVSDSAESTPTCAAQALVPFRGA